MTLIEIQTLLHQHVRYHEWRFDVHQDADFGYLQLAFYAFGPDFGSFALQGGRKWKLSPHMTKSEIVQTAWLAVLTAVEHEAREEFTYKGVAIFGPHLDCEALREVAGRRDVRDVRAGEAGLSPAVIDGETS
jgi:hypothetical protein